MPSDTDQRSKLQPIAEDEHFSLFLVGSAPNPQHLRLSKGHVAFVFHLGGNGVAMHLGTKHTLQPETRVLFSEGTDLMWSSEKASAVIVSFSTAFLAKQLASFRPGLLDSLRKMVFDQEAGVATHPLEGRDRSWLCSLKFPPVYGLAMHLWYASKAQELLAWQAFGESQAKEGFFCVKQRHIASERVAKVKWILSQRLDEPIDLEGLAKKVGCSTHYLCRTFSAETGITISRYLRSIRIAQAAKYLRSGRFNVSEAAVEVGYNSMSHFSKAFQEETGCLPSHYAEERRREASPFTPLNRRSA